MLTTDRYADIWLANTDATYLYVRSPPIRLKKGGKKKKRWSGKLRSFSTLSETDSGKRRGASRLAHPDGRAGQPSGGSGQGARPLPASGLPRALPWVRTLRLPRLFAAPHAPTPTCGLPKRLPPQPLEVSGPLRAGPEATEEAVPSFPQRRRPQPGRGFR